MSLASAEHRLFVHRIAEAWAGGSEAPSQPEGTLWRGSWAGMCARKVAYMTTEQERTDPPSTADYWRMGLPLEILVVAVSVPMILLVWPLHG